MVALSNTLLLMHLFPAQQPLHGRRCEAEQRVQTRRHFVSCSPAEVVTLLQTGRLLWLFQIVADVRPVRRSSEYWGWFLEATPLAARFKRCWLGGGVAKQPSETPPHYLTSDSLLAPLWRTLGGRGRAAGTSSNVTSRIIPEAEVTK